MNVSLVLILAFFTSALSGVLGMAGGSILMAGMVLFLPVSKAMVLHALIQFVANGTRAIVLRQHLSLGLLIPYVVGAGVALAVFISLAFTPSANLVLILIGLFPLAAELRLFPRDMDITRPLTGIVCGLVVTSAQLLAGVAGPVLDSFYQQSPLQRQSIVANKALTQALGHSIRMLYYGFLLALPSDLPMWVLGVAIAVAVLGTQAGTALLQRWNEDDFRKISRWVILSVATLCLGRGLYGALV